MKFHSRLVIFRSGTPFPYLHLPACLNPVINHQPHLGIVPSVLLVPTGAAGFEPDIQQS